MGICDKLIDCEEVGKRIRAYREARKMSQKELAIDADISFGTMSEIESGKYNIPNMRVTYRINLASVIANMKNSL